MSLLRRFFGIGERRAVTLTATGAEEAIRKSFPGSIRRIQLTDTQGGVHLDLVEFKNGHSLMDIQISSQKDWESIEARMAMLYDLPPL